MQITSLVYFDCGHSALLSSDGRVVAGLQLPARLDRQGILSAIEPKFRGHIGIKAAPATLCKICFPADSREQVPSEQFLRELIISALIEEGLPRPSDEELTRHIEDAKKAEKLYEQLAPKSGAKLQ